MDENEEVIARFYNAFARRDHAAMNECYTSDIMFSDPVFGLLRGVEVNKMWEMLCKNAVNLDISFSNIRSLGEDYYTCDWVASYTFSKTGRNVVNNVRAYMRFSNGKICEHSDGFSIHKWSKQAIGLTGLFFGWNSFFQNKIRKQAKRNLQKFMQATG
jgi:ketosteroid isomerase-like protein